MGLTLDYSKLVSLTLYFMHIAHKPPLDYKLDDCLFMSIKQKWPFIWTSFCRIPYSIDISDYLNDLVDWCDGSPEIKISQHFFLFLVACWNMIR